MADYTFGSPACYVLVEIEATIFSQLSRPALFAMGPRFKENPVRGGIFEAGPSWRRYPRQFWRRVGTSLDLRRSIDSGYAKKPG